MDNFIVYIKTDDAGRVIAVNSSAFVTDAEGWTKIDEGIGDRYHHAQGNYLPLPLMDERGVCRYKLEGGAVVERTQAEMDADWVEPEKKPSVEERLSALEMAGLERDSALIELAAMLTGGAV